MIHHEYMRLALSLAGKAKGFTSPNPCVGAVVVKDGNIVGQGYHRAAGLSHAEVAAINDAGNNAKDAALYVTLEPCNHHGSTPPCTQEIIHAGINTVYIGCKDPNPFVSGGGIAFLREHGVTVKTGVLKEDAQDLIEDFIWYIQNDKKPFVILKSAATLDGNIATATGDSKWITNEKSRRYAHQMRQEADAILIGSGTLQKDNPSLTARLSGKRTRDPVRIILDTRLRIKEDAKVITQASDAITIIATGPDVSNEKRTRLTNAGVKIIEVSIKDQRLDLDELMVKLGQMSILSVLIEGGAIVAGAALKSGIVNKMLYFLAPKVLGGDDGVKVFKGKGPALIKNVYTFKKMDVRLFDNDILVQGYLK